ncbi:penicillin-binding protein [Phenylobacterium sp. Root77]|uniref:peptidoglycan D,D-transpeptidase FtsI family protein n=1 Tax=unclassified Phenylobacterium TaxID=2640670 RepID=UPI0006FFD6D8|nr:MULTISPECIES: penicillin-binding protein 2 [unclassified Phenylobacterium]KQW72194.1 penicillin-binding protein [Phenylobacterium sp. Root1277]KQW95114.1 penicillin-binding protein [Phenylobacterium sp. Root1290]KRC44807.1 penicillin-binding protein [Phenylobacterium sp. Root77]
MSLAHPSLEALGWRWLKARVWGLEHAFERAKAAGKAEDDTRIRIFFVLALFSAAFALLAIGATRAALFSDAGRSGGYAGPVGASRADLVDRNGAMLAADLLHYGIYVDPREIWDADETRRALRSALPNLNRQRLEKVLASERRGFVAAGLTPEVRARIHALGLPGVTFEPEERRVYPLGTTAAHLIGFADTGGVGLAGAERALNDTIRGGAASKTAVPLSIDLRVQAALEDELYKAAAEFQPRGAVGIVTNVHTGEILGMASYPTFDPNQVAKADDDAKLNRAAASIYEMGSTFKAFTVAIGLDTGVANPSSTFDARVPYQLGYRTIKDYHATRKILTLVDVFIHSSNIGTAKLAESVGAERLHKYFDNLGLTRPAQVELLESARPLSPRKWDMDAVASTSFGHGMNVSPLAVTGAMGALLNGGYMVPLTIKKMDAGRRPQGQRVLSEQTSLQMLQIMRANVISGSGKSANAPGLSVGGKTGTGEKYDPAIRGYSTQRQVSSFAAVFPTAGAVQEDRYFVLILMDEPHGTAKTYGYSTGGWVAAPAAGRVIDRIAPFLGVQRQPDLIKVVGEGSVAAEPIADGH